MFKIAAQPFTFLITLIFLSVTSSVEAQAPTTVDSLRNGDIVVFSEAPDAKRFVVIGKEQGTLSCSILNDEGLLDTVVVRKTTVVQAYKNSLNRKRLSIYTPGTKLRWKQRGKRVEGFLKSYSPADPDLTVDVYLDDKLEERRVPVKYATPAFMESMADTMQWLCNVWQAPDQLLSYVPVDSVIQGMPRMEHVKLGPSDMKGKVQYVMEDYKFAMVFKENLNHGIVGNWRVQDELIIISTKLAIMNDEDGKRKAIPCAAEYKFEYELKERGTQLSLTLIDWEIYEEKWRQIEEAKIAKEKAAKELAELQAAIEAGFEPDGEIDDTSIDTPPASVKIDQPNSTNMGNETAPVSELDVLKAEIEALKKEMAKMKAEMKKKHGEG